MNQRWIPLSKSRKQLEQIIELVTPPASNWIHQLLSRNQCSLITFVNPSALIHAGHYPDYLSNLSHFDYIFPDGILIARLAQRIKGERIPRISFDGNSIALEVFKTSSQYDKTIYIVGGYPGIAEKAALNYHKTFGVRIAGCRNGCFQNESELNEFCIELSEKAPDIVICGMGVGLQENFLLQLRGCGWRGAGFTCGGFIEQTATSSSIQYYPAFINKYNLRALYRVYKEPKRLSGRYLFEYLPFYIAAFSILIGNLKRD